MPNLSYVSSSETMDIWATVKLTSVSIFGPTTGCLFLKLHFFLATVEDAVCTDSNPPVCYFNKISGQRLQSIAGQQVELIQHVKKPLTAALHWPTADHRLGVTSLRHSYLL